MKAKLLLGTILLFPTIIFSQLIPTANTECTTSALNYDPGPIQLGPEPVDVLCIDLIFHIVKNNDGSSAFFHRSVDQMVIQMRSHFGSHGIRLNLREIREIRNSSLVNLELRSEAIAMVDQHNVDGVINFYIVEELQNLLGDALSIPSTNAIVTAEGTYSTTPSHELGHCLGLLHTDATSECFDLPDESTDCLECGDMICDTPPDSGAGKVNGYNPDLINLMSFYDNTSRFTTQQGLRMIDFIEDHPTLAGVNSKVEDSKISIANYSGGHVVSEGQWRRIVVGYEGRSTSDFDWEWSFSGEGVNAGVKYIGSNKSMVDYKAIVSMGAPSGGRTVYIKVRGTDQCGNLSEWITQEFVTDGCGGAPGSNCPNSY